MKTFQEFLNEGKPETGKKYKDTSTGQTVILKGMSMEASSISGMERIAFVKVDGFGGKRYNTKVKNLQELS